MSTVIISVLWRTHRAQPFPHVSKEGGMLSEHDAYIQLETCRLPSYLMSGATLIGYYELTVEICLKEFSGEEKTILTVLTTPLHSTAMRRKSAEHSLFLALLACPPLPSLAQLPLVTISSQSRSV